MSQVKSPRVTPPLAAQAVVDESGRIQGSRCADCGKLVFPAVPICSECLSERLEPYAFSGDGVIYTFTVLHQGARGWDAPYVLGYVDLPEGVRVFSHLTGCDPQDLRIGMPVTMVPAEAVLNFEGMEVVSYKFTVKHAPG
jgi:uncharacterized protein